VTDFTDTPRDLTPREHETIAALAAEKRVKAILEYRQMTLCTLAAAVLFADRLRASL
jgi:hypothetical protein